MLKYKDPLSTRIAHKNSLCSLRVTYIHTEVPRRPFKRSFLRLRAESVGDIVKERNEGPMLETLDYTIRIGSIPTFLYFDLYLYSAYAAHDVYCKGVWLQRKETRNIRIRSESERWIPS